MDLPLDPASQEIIQREVERGHYATPAEVVANSLALLEDHNLWLSVDKEALNRRLDESLAQVERGEGMTGEQLKAFLNERRASWRT